MSDILNFFKKLNFEIEFFKFQFLKVNFVSLYTDKRLLLHLYPLAIVKSIRAMKKQVFFLDERLYQ